jgi:hypothetical protein
MADILRPSACREDRAVFRIKWTGGEWVVQLGVAMGHHSAQQRRAGLPMALARPAVSTLRSPPEAAQSPVSRSGPSSSLLSPGDALYRPAHSHVLSHALTGPEDFH